MSRKGIILVITGPSGSGKTTVYKTLLSRRKDLVFSVSYTTRKKRADEVQGKDYFFIDQKEFERKIQNGDFVEWAEVHGELYGTEKKQIEECLENQSVCILDIDVQGALNIKKEYPEALMLFIVPPSIAELKKRLKKRGTENDEQINRRLNNAKNELEYRKYFNYIFTNQDVEKTTLQIEKIIQEKTGEIDAPNL